MLDWEFVICESGTNGNRIVAFYICVGDEFLGVRFGSNLVGSRSHFQLALATCPYLCCMSPLEYEIKLGWQNIIGVTET